MVSIREFVAHLPPDKRELLAAPARLLPVKRRYGPIYERTIREIEKARATPSWARATVDERLAETFRTAREAPYYGRNEHYDVLDRVASGDMAPREALAELPILTREEVSAHYRDMLAAPEKTVELSASSGTSGDPIFFLLDRNRGAREWAYVVDSWWSTGYKLGQWRVFFRGLDLPQHRPYFVMNSTGEIVIRIQTIGPDTIREYWELIEKRGIEFLHGYPSTFMYLARLLEDADFDTSWRFKVRGVLPVSEQFGPEQRDVLQRLFPNAEQAVFYGLSEKSVFARLDDDFVYHPYPLYGHVELLNEDGSPVGVGERGRIVTTTLDGRGMPLVRYDTGDSAELVGHDEVGTPLWAEGRDTLAVKLGRRYAGALARVWSVAFLLLAAVCVALAVGGGPWGWVLALGMVATASAFQRLFVVQRQARNWPLLGQFMESVVLPALGLVGALVTSVLAPDWLIASQVMAFVLVTLVLYAASPSVHEGRARRRRAARSAPDVPFTGRHARAVPEPDSIYVPRHASGASHPDDVAYAPIPWRPALTVGAGNALTSLCVRGPMFVIGGQSLAAAGVYEVAQKIQSGGAMGTSAVATVFAPRIAVALRKPTALIKLLVQAGGSSLVVPLGLLAFLFVVGSDGLVAVLGDEYQGAWAASVVLVVSTVVNAITSAMSNVMILGGRERMFVVIAAVQMLLVVGGSLVSGADTAVSMALWVLVGEAFRSACMVAGLMLHLRSVRT